MNRIAAISSINIHLARSPFPSPPSLLDYPRHLIFLLSLPTLNHQKNLPNKRSIGKQDPYCVLYINKEEQRTKPDKRGGQHPHWDEQLHFDIYEDMEDALKRGLTSADDDSEGGGTIKPKNLTTTSKGKKVASKSMRVACYADDTREPELIGEGIVDLTETLKVGEFDGELIRTGGWRCKLGR